jgi:charged multivesicular body protein 2A
MFKNFQDDALGDDDDEEESDAIVTQVLDELGLQLTDQVFVPLILLANDYFNKNINKAQKMLLWFQMTGLPIASGSLSVATKDSKTAVPAGPIADADADLQARLDNLRKE